MFAACPTHCSECSDTNGVMVCSKCDAKRYLNDGLCGGNIGFLSLIQCFV